MASERAGYCILSKNINTYTFHIHVAAAFWITNENMNIGTMKEMGDSENEANSFEVLSWLALPVAQFAPHPDMYGNGYINSQGYSKRFSIFLRLPLTRNYSTGANKQTFRGRMKQLQKKSEHSDHTRLARF